MKKIKGTTVALIIVMLIYTIISFTNLGDKNSPQTYKTFDNGEITYLRLSKESTLGRVNIFTANDISNFEVSLISSSINQEQNINTPSSNSEQSNFQNSSDGYAEYKLNTDNLYGNVFKWLQFDINSLDTYSYIVIKSYDTNNVLGEIAAFDKNGDQIKVESFSGESDSLTDEQDLAPYTSSYMNSTYFDEIYHPRTAYEQLHNLPIYECVHPPLGKILISIPIQLFGMSPFNYRLMGNIAGILMILVMYFIGKTLFKKEKYGLISAIIMALDGMHFTQTRIATVDSFLVLFSMLSFLFMIKYIYMDDKAAKKKKLLNLCLSGIFIGMAIATKWTAFFVALGLAIIFFIHLLYKIYKFNHSNIKMSPNFSLAKEVVSLLLYCVLFFVVIPICIYLMAYIPLFLNPSCSIKDFSSFIEYQKNILKYHSSLQATHPYSSSWYTWPLLYKPVWYYISYYPNNMVSTIACMGNPLIFWFGIATTLFSLIHSIMKRKKEAINILVLIATTWLCYAFIGRVMFLYHYFITLPFVMLTIVYFIKVLDDTINKKFIANIITAFILIAFLVSFIYFFPVYSGHIVSTDYIEQTKWLSSWVY